MAHPGDRFVAALDDARARTGEGAAMPAAAGTGARFGAVDTVREALERARRTRDAQILSSLAPATLVVYARDWKAFVAWCAAHAATDPSLVPLPASDATLSTWIGSMDALRPATVRRKLVAVRLVHRWAAGPVDDAGLPLTLAAVKGHARRHANVAPRQSRAATGDLVWRLVDACDKSTLTGVRNRALILVGFDAALRASELVALDHEHLTRTGDGISLAVRRFKADRSGRGRTVSLAARPGSPWCPVAALETWIEASGRTSGAVFVGARCGRPHPGVPVGRISTRAVSRTVQVAAVAAGLATDTLNDFSGHSLRRGLISTALDAGAPRDDVMHHARHGSPRPTLLHREADDAARRQPRVAIGPPDDAAASACTSPKATNSPARTPDG